MEDPRRGATSASSAEADSLCPGRFLAQVGLPDVKSEAAESGTRIHAALAGQTVTLTPDELELAKACKEVEEKLVQQVFGPSKTTVWSEQRYWCKIKAGDATYEHSGQADKVYRYGTRALIIDYKTGQGEQKESPKNLQLRDLAVLVQGNLIVPEIFTAIVQPLATMKPELCVYQTGELQQAKTEMFARVIKSRDPKSPRVAGEVQCKYCRATRVCSEYQKWAGSMLPATKPITDVPMASWDAQQCALFCAGRAVAQRWLDDAEAMIKGRLAANPDAIPGWCLKEGKTRSTVVDPTALCQRFLASGGTQDQFLKTVSIALGAFKDQVREAMQLKGNALDQKVKELMQGLVETKRDQPSLAKKKE